MNASLLNRRAFMASGNLLLASLRARRRRLTMVLMEADELSDIEVQHGTAVAMPMRHVFAGKLLAVAGRLGAAAQTGAYEYVGRAHCATCLRPYGIVPYILTRGDNPWRSCCKAR